jgi:hypothetical protein
MPLVDLFQSFDLHIHSNPSLFFRSGSDVDMARHAAEAGLAGILLKNHFESTVGRAFQADEVVEGTRVFGGLVLNHFTGGLNAVAVEHALKLGAKQIWMPTLDAAGHVQVFGHAGGFGYQESGTEVEREGISVLDARGELKEEAKMIVKLVRKAGAILGTAHLARDEIFSLARFAQEEGFKGLLITHPYFNPPRLSVSDQVELARMGATIELCGGNLYPIPGTARIEDYVKSVAEVGADSLILSSDAGQPRKSLPAEVLRVFAQCLMEKGISQEQINLMTKENPARLLGLE